jgi:4-amino-4-deoxy-L-arabinose transferase-like glycosyltransferase
MSRLLASVRRVPRAGRACALIALVNAAVWSLVVPPFQVPDETSHFAYAQYVSETGAPPPQKPGAAPFSDEEQLTLEKLRFNTVIGYSDQRPIGTAAEEQALRTALETDPSPRGQGGTTSATNQPPLYYALTAIPYWLSPSHGILTRLAVMRLLSALLAAGTVLCVYLFLRELLPGTPWAWTVGALAVAFQPTFMFISAGVQSDNLLFLASAATMLALARAFRLGLTAGRGAAIGGAVAVGILGKLTFLAFLPGIALALALLVWRDRHRDRRAVAVGGLLAGTVAFVPVALYGLLNVVAWHRGGGTTGGGVGAATVATGGSSIMERLSYIWQEFLPRLPFMQNAFDGFGLWDIWFRGFIGSFGWLDYQFAGWVYSLAGVVFMVVFGLGISGAFQLLRGPGWKRMMWRTPLALVLVVMGVGLVIAIGWQGISYRKNTGYQFEQARYLLPLLCLYGLLVALAARGAGRRWGPVVGGGLVVLAMAHGLFAELLTIARYYG